MEMGNVRETFPSMSNAPEEKWKENSYTRFADNYYFYLQLTLALIYILPMEDYIFQLPNLSPIEK